MGTSLCPCSHSYRRCCFDYLHLLFSVGVPYRDQLPLEEGTLSARVTFVGTWPASTHTSLFYSRFLQGKPRRAPLLPVVPHTRRGPTPALTGRLRQNLPAARGLCEQRAPAGAAAVAKRRRLPLTPAPAPGLRCAAAPP